MAYKFVYKRDDKDGAYTAVSTIEMHVDDDATVTQMCEAFEQFLRAAGYSFKGNIEIATMDEVNNEKD